MLSLQQISGQAAALGFGDLRVASPDPMPATQPGMDTDPAALLPGVRSILVLFWPYAPAAPAPPGYMALSNYYVHSERAHTAVAALTEWLRAQGVQALARTRLSARTLAARTGGAIGKNALYYHPQFGSFVAIQHILTDLPLPFCEERAAPLPACRTCRACAQACPAGAIGDSFTRGQCLRQYLDTTPMHPAGREHVYQLSGCEKCQAACPYNRAIQPVSGLSYPLPALLAGAHTDELQRIAGANMARPLRILEQALVYAARTGMLSPDALAGLEQYPLLQDTLHWARKRLPQSPPG